MLMSLVLIYKTDNVPAERVAAVLKEHGAAERGCGFSALTTASVLHLDLRQIETGLSEGFSSLNSQYFI